MKMDNIMKFIVFPVALILFSSCEEITDWDFKPANSNTLSVEAIITDEYKTHEIILSLSFPRINEKPLPATEAEIALSTGNDIVLFTEDQLTPGLYKSNKAFQAKLNLEYSLEIKWQNQLYKAVNDMVQVLPFEPVNFKPFSGSDSLTFDQLPPAFSPDEQAMYEITVDWSEIKPSEKTQSKYLYFTFSTIDVNEIFKPDRQIPVFPGGSKVIEKKYSLNKKTAHYFRSILMETEWQGGVFDEASAPVKGNFSNGALGYFCVCSTLADTLIAN